MLLLIILTFITVVLIMTGALVPVLIYGVAIAAVIYIIFLAKKLLVGIFMPPHAGSDPVSTESAPVESAPVESMRSAASAEESDEASE